MQMKTILIRMAQCSSLGACQVERCSKEQKILNICILHVLSHTHAHNFNRLVSIEVKVSAHMPLKKP